MDETDELRAYRANVERLAAMQSSEIFTNSRPEHAVIILQTFCKFASEHVVVFCQKLSERTYGGQPLIDSVEQALHRRVKISVVVQEEPEAQYFIDAAIRWKKEGLPISVSMAQSIDPPAEVNFAVMDEKGFRFENNRMKPEAFACMNNAGTASSLLRRFFQIEKGATPLLTGFWERLNPLRT